MIRPPPRSTPSPHSTPSRPRPVAPRQTVSDGANASAGQSASEPLQLSAVSQGPADARPTVTEGANESAGDAWPAVPEHAFATLQVARDALDSVAGTAATVAR